MNKKDWLLIAIESAGNTGLTPIQLQKSLFLIGQSLKIKEYYSFVPYSYGPFDSNIYTDAESLVKEGLVTTSYDKSHPYPRYTISSTGVENTIKIKSQLKDSEETFVSKTVNFVNSLSFKQLLKIVYENYPAYAINSVFKG